MNTIHRTEPQKNDTQLVPACTTQLVRFRQTALSDHTPYQSHIANRSPHEEEELAMTD